MWEKKNGFNWSILKASVITVIPQLSSPTLFVLLWFGTGSTRSGHGKAGEIEHVLMSSVWALHRESNWWTKFHFSDHTFALEVHYVLTIWEADDFLHSGLEREIAEKLVWSLIVLTLVHLSQSEAGALGMCCDTPLHDARWPAAATCATFHNVSPNTLKSLCTLLGLVALNFQEKQLKVLLKALTNTLLQAYQAAFEKKTKKPNKKLK